VEFGTTAIVRLEFRKLDINSAAPLGLFISGKFGFGTATLIRKSTPKVYMGRSTSYKREMFVGLSLNRMLQIRKFLQRRENFSSISMCITHLFHPYCEWKS